ncbi:type VI secretion system-associated protein TagO [Methylobacterium fujisawaense]|uniref:type VI secretion system-associated protein TagO n=2 Tax=Methylobacterium fujisawaense TaxID=107400 RepID=UPI0031F5B8FB
MKTAGRMIALVVFAIAPAWAGTPALPEIDACRATRDRVGRLLCFDALFKTPVEDSAAETPPPETAKVIRKPSPLRELGLDQERGRPDGVAGALVRIRPWRSAAFVEPTTFEGILTGRAGQAADLPADQRAWTADTADVFLTLREGDGVSPLGRGTLDQRSVIMLACEDDITAFYILLPKPVGHARTKFALTTDRGVTLNLHWRDYENGDVILAGRGLESIDLIKSLINSRRLAIQIDYPDGPQTYLFEAGQLTEALRPLRRACHW